MKQALMLTLGLLLTIAPTARAQSQPVDRMSVEAGVVADMDPNAYRVYDYDIQPAIAVAIGVPLSRQWTARFETTVPVWHRTPFASLDFVSGGSSIQRTGTGSHRIITYGFLVGRNFAPAARLRLTPVLGFSAADHADREDVVITTTRQPSGATSVLPRRTDSHSLVGTVVWGADFSVALSNRIAIVPQIRLHVPVGYDHARTVIRPGVVTRIGL